MQNSGLQWTILYMLQGKQQWMKLSSPSFEISYSLQKLIACKDDCFDFAYRSRSRSLQKTNCGAAESYDERVKPVCNIKATCPKVMLKILASIKIDLVETQLPTEFFMMESVNELRSL